MTDDSQLELDFTLFDPKLSKEELSVFLNENMPTRVDLTLTRNRVTMMSVNIPPEGPISLRLHEQFLEAPNEVLSALRRYLKTRRKADWRTAADYAQAITPALRGKSRPVKLKPQGRVYNLTELYDLVNLQEFNNELRLKITWGRRSRRKGAQQSIRYGSYDSTTRTITIHPALDASDIPVEFVKYVVFHEMLHAVIPPAKARGQIRFHPPEFRMREKRYPGFHRMQKLAKSILMNLS